jgi:hypothetical protein
MARASQQNYSEDEKDDADVEESALAGDADSEKGRAQRDERDAAFRHLSRLHSQGSLNLLTHVRSKDTFEPAKFQQRNSLRLSPSAHGRAKFARTPIYSNCAARPA